MCKRSDTGLASTLGMPSPEAVDEGNGGWKPVVVVNDELHTIQGHQLQQPRSRAQLGRDTPAASNHMAAARAECPALCCHASIARGCQLDFKLEQGLMEQDQRVQCNAGAHLQIAHSLTALVC